MALLLLSISSITFLIKQNQDIRKKAAENPNDINTTGPVRGVSGDTWADIIIGKPNFGEINPYTTVGNKLFLPHGTIVDRTVTPNKLYVYDAGNNRVLGFDLGKCLSSATNPLACSADLVIGQPSSLTGACNGDSGFQNYPARAAASASSLCGLQESQVSISEGGSGASMAVDVSGNLYVPDFWNHRVLKYNQPFSTDKTGGKGDSVADDVWGQNDFTGNSCNKGQAGPDSTTLCFSWGDSNNWTAGVDIDSLGNLWVADSGNNRIVRFPPGSKAADLVLGQSDLISKSAGSGLSQFHDPGVIRVSNQGKVYVSDHYNNRVLTFSQPYTNGMSGALFGSDFLYPSGVDFDPTQTGVWIYNEKHSIWELRDETTQVVINSIGQKDNGNLLGEASGSMGIDSSGNKFVAIGIGDYDNDVLVYDKNATFSPTKQFFGKGQNYVDSAGLGSARGVVVSDGQLIIADNGRILFWNIPNGVSDLTNGKPADGVIVASDFSHIVDGCCFDIKADKNHHLYVSYYLSAAIPAHVEIFNLPLTTGLKSIVNLQYPFNLLGGGQMTTSYPANEIFGLIPSDDGNFLWVSHKATNRVFRVRNPLTTPLVDVVLGQTDPYGTLCNFNELGGFDYYGQHPYSNSLCYPGKISLDKLGNLFVSDSSVEINGNMRLLEFSKDLFPINNSSVIYAPDATKIFPNTSGYEAAFDSTGKMVYGFNPYYIKNPKGGLFPGAYLDPLGTNTGPDYQLSDYYSMAYSTTFDDANNLYLGDLNRSRVLIYLKPAGPTPTPTPTIAPTPTPNPLSCTFDLKWGTFGTGDGQFNYPSGLTIDNSGNIYVTDLNNNRIQKFSSSGQFITKWGTPGTGDGQFRAPIDITTDQSRNVYVIDWGNNRIQKFSSSGQFLAKWGTFGTGDGQFNYPFGLTIDNSGNIYVTDLSNNRIQKFSSSGQFLTKWGTPGTGDGQFNYPIDITGDQFGNVYVSDLGSNRVQNFSSSGQFLAEWGTAGTGDGQFNYPSGLATDQVGNVYVTDLNNNRVQKFLCVPPTQTPTPSLSPIPIPSSTPTPLPSWVAQIPQLSDGGFETYTADTNLSQSYTYNKWWFWTGGGTKTSDYSGTVVSSEKHNGANSIKIHVGHASGPYGNITGLNFPQLTTSYTGKYLKFSGWAKTSVNGQAQLNIVYIDSKGVRNTYWTPSLSSIINRTSWTKLETPWVQIPTGSTGIEWNAYGMGADSDIWFDDFAVTDVPNCSNLTGPASASPGQTVTYQADFSSPEGNAGQIMIGQNGIATIFSPIIPISANNKHVNFTFPIPNTASTGSYDSLCRVWNDGISECRGKENYVDTRPRYFCEGPLSSVVLNIITPTAIPTTTPLPPTPTPKY